MADPSTSNPSSTALQYRQGQEALSNWNDLPGMSRLMLRVAMAVTASAAFTFMWVPLGFVKTFMLAGLGQGVSLGIGLAKAFRASRLRRRSIGFPITIAASVITDMLVYFALYVREVFRLFMALRPPGGHPITPTALLRSQPFHMYNMLVLTPRGVPDGFPGYFLLRLRDSVFVNIVLVHLAVTAFVAWRICRRQMRAAFCESCGRWLQPKNAAVLPPSFTDPLVLAVNSNDVEQALAVTHAASQLPLKNSCVVARAYHCTSCDENWVDVILKIYGRRGGNSVAMKMTKVSDEFLAALRSEPVLEEESPETAAG
jgi:hypothetical protein